MLPLHVAAAFLLAIGLASGKAPDRPKVKVGMPVLQELMGGCSLTCSFPWKPQAGADAKRIAAINDANASTAWLEARVGSRLEFRFPSNLPRALNGTPFYGIDIVNGRLHPESGYEDYGRFKKIRLFHNGKAVHDIELADTRRWLHVEFEDIFLNVGDTLAVEVLEIHPGTKHETAAVTEIVLLGAH